MRDERIGGSVDGMKPLKQVVAMETCLPGIIVEIAVPGKQRRRRSMACEIVDSKPENDGLYNDFRSLSLDIDGCAVGTRCMCGSRESKAEKDR